METPLPRSPYRAGAQTYALEHRAFARLDRRTQTVLEAVVLTIVGTGAWVAALPAVSRLWGHVLVAMAGTLDTPVDTVLRIHDVLGMEIAVPYWAMTFALPGPVLLFGVGLGTLALAVGTFFLHERWRPGVYLARAALAVQASAVIYFALWPELFEYTLGDYLQGMTATGLAIATATPLVLGLTFYVQDLSLPQKVGFTAMTMAYSVILVPLQYALHGLLLSAGTALWMPLVYLFLGIPLHVFALVSLYAWGMSWDGRLPALGIPDAPLPAPAPTPVSTAAPLSSTHDSQLTPILS